MSRYIDADAIDIRAREGYSVDGVLYLPYRDIRKSLDSAPSIDIVRCKECKHWDRAIDESGTIERFNFSECTKGHYGNGLEFYCADGERKEGE